MGNYSRAATFKRKSLSVSCYLLWIAGRDVKAGKEEYNKKEGLVVGFVSKEVKHHKFYRCWHQKSAENLQAIKIKYQIQLKVLPSKILTEIF